MLANGSLKFMLGAIVSLFVATQGGRLEGMAFPVVSDTHVYRIDAVEPASSRIWGKSLIRRDCEFHHLEWNYGYPGSSVGIDVQFEEGTKIREPGMFNFGPWLLQLDPAEVEHRSFAQVFHRCHPLWLTETRFYP